MAAAHQLASRPPRAHRRFPLPARRFPARRLPLPALGLTLALCGCGTESGDAPFDPARQRRVTLDDGREVVVPRHPRRIVVANTALVDAVTALVEPARVAALCSQAWTWSRLARDPGPWRAVSTFERFAVETVLARQPDLVLCTPFSRPESVSTLRAQGLALVQLADPTDIPGVLARVRTVGALLDAPDRTAALVDALETRIAALRAAAPQAPADRPRAVIYTHSGGEGWTAGGGTLADAMLELAGLRNAVAERGTRGNARLTFEELIGLDPDLLVVPAAFGEVDGATARVVRNEPALRTLRVRSDEHERVVELHPALFSTTSHEIVTAAEQLAAARPPAAPRRTERR